MSRTGKAGAGPVARGQPVHAFGPGARAHAGDRSIRTSLGRPARSGVTVQRAFGIRSATACTVASSWSAPISRNATPPGSSDRRQAVDQAAHDVEAVRPAVERGGRLERESRATGAAARRSGRTGGSRTPRRTAARRGTAGGPRRRTPSGRRRRARPRSRAPAARASADTSTAMTSTCVVHLPAAQGREQGDAIAPVPVPTSTTRSAGAPGGPRGGREARGDLGQRGVDEQLRLGSRDQGARVGREREPVELAEAADVGDGLAALAALDGGLERLRARPRRRARPGGRGRPSGPSPSVWPSSSSASRRARVRSRTRRCARSRRGRARTTVDAASAIGATSGW